MAVPAKPTKQATKGQKQIFKENQETITWYTNGALGVSGIYVLSMLLGTFTGYYSEPIYTMKYIVYIAISSAIYYACIALFKYMATAKLSGNTVVDGGLDLNMEGGMADYVKDIFLLNAIVQLASLYTNYAWLGGLCAPVYAGYKITVSFILPWVFAPAPEVDEEKEDKKQKKMDRKARRAGGM